MKMKTLPQVMTQAVTALEDYLLSLKPETEGYGEELRRTAHSLATVVGTFTKTLEASDYEQRLDNLQRKLNELEKQSTPNRTRNTSEGVGQKPLN
jgi:hypothetical protein